MIGTSDTAFPRINNIAFWMLVPSMLFGVLSCLIDEGPGTGWTLIWCFKMSFIAWITNLLILIKQKILNYFKFIYKVTRFNIIGQYASYKKLQRLNMTKLLIKFGFKTSKPNSLNINEWIVGLTDGDGTFNIYINKTNKKIIFTFKISLLEQNRQLLYKLKKYLNVGKLDYSKNNNQLNFKITDKESLLNKIIPIFDNYPLLTSKQFNYLKFKKSLLISNDPNLSQIEKINLIEIIKNDTNYVSNVWTNIDIFNIKYKDIHKIMTKSWLVGFIEAEGSFYLVNKTNKRIVHAFGITQKSDLIVLESIRLLLNITANVRNRGTFYSLDCTNSNDILNIINYFMYNDNKSYFSGMKSYEFSIWKKSFFKYKGNYNKWLEN